jgi:hypothetical protein
MIEFTGEVPLQLVVQNFSKALLQNEQDFRDKSSVDTTTQVNLSRQPFVEPIIEIPPEWHTWYNINLTLSAIIFGLYLLIWVIV